MTDATATEPLADVQEGDYVISVFPAHQRSTSADDLLSLHRVTRRTPRRIWIGPDSHRLSGEPVSRWGRGRIRLPKPGEVEELRANARAKAEALQETGKEYSRKRERYIALIYAAARADRHVEFLDLLCHWESGTWDVDLDRIDAANQPEGA